MSEKALLLFIVLGPWGHVLSLKKRQRKKRKPVFWVIDVLSILLHPALYATLIFISE